jgi:phage gpG-like protein
MDFTITDNTDEVIAAKDEAIERALEAIGLQAEGYAKMLCPVGTPESTGIEGYHGGTLRNSISHTTDHSNGEDSAIIGSNIPYAPYVEHGTGLYADNGNGRKSPWIWVDENGKPHKTSGMTPRHFLKNAIADHIDEYKDITENYLKNS